MSFTPRDGVYYRMPVFFGPTPGPRQWPSDVSIDFSSTPKNHIAGVRFLSERDALQALLPDCFEVAGEPVVTVNVHYMTELGWLAGRGYDMFDVKFDVVHHGRNGDTLGTLVLVRFENLCDPILSGREELGHNKLYCEIPALSERDGHHSLELSWLGHPFLDMSVWDLQQADAPPVSDGHQGMLSYKYVPATGEWGRPDVAYATLTPTAATSTVIQRLRGSGSVRFRRSTWQDLPTLHHLINTLADLPMLETVDAFMIRSEGGQSGATTRRLD